MVVVASTVLLLASVAVAVAFIAYEIQTLCRAGKKFEGVKHYELDDPKIHRYSWRLYKIR